MEERRLMERIAAGDEDALQALLRRYGALIRYVLRPIVQDARDREECYADISLKIWRSAGSFDGEKGTLRAWLTALSRNAALNYARRRAEPDAPLEDDLPHSGGSAEEELLRQERQRRLRAAVTAMTEAERQLFYRKYYYCQSTAQMAAELGLTERAVEGRLYRLRQRLRELLGGDFCE